MMKKLISLVLVFTMALSLCAFASAESSETIKIGVEIYDPTDEEFLELKDYFDNYLAPALNLEFVYSEAIGDADAEFAFIDNCAAAGCVAIIGYYNVAGAEAGWHAIEAGLYYTNTSESAIYDELNGEELYLGAIIYGENGDYEAGYAMGAALAELGCTTVVYANGGADYGVEMFIDRQTGFLEGLGEDAEVITVSGFPGTDAFSSDQNSALTTEGVDAVATSYNALAAWVQPIAAAGLDVPVATIGVVSDDFVTAMEEGQITVLVATNIERYALEVAMIYQAVNGNKIVDEDGNAPLLIQAYLTFTNAEDLAAYNEMRSTDHVYNSDEILAATTVEDLEALAASYTLEDITARRG